MHIAFIIARLFDNRSIVTKQTLKLAKAIEAQGHQVTIISFNKLDMLWPFNKIDLMNKSDFIIVGNIGLQTSFYAICKWLGLIRKPLGAIAFGSDIREYDTLPLIKLWNLCCKNVLDVVITVNPDITSKAQQIGYRKVRYLNNWY